jgi:adenosylcobinamide-GDP ribazoletransferase
MKPLLAAIRFLTILPLPGSWGTAEADLARSVPWFPVIGLLLGGVAAAVAWALALAAPPMVVAAVTVIVLLSFSGCLHLDGLADTADGFLSARSRERILEIMKDSHVGAMGVIVILCVLLLKFASLASLPVKEPWPAVWLMPLAGRCALVMHMALLPYARPEGLGAVFYRCRPRWAAVWAAAVLAAAAYGLLGLDGALKVWVACIAVTLAFSAYVFGKIGGATGDTLGAVCEIVEVVPALTLVMGPLDVVR